MAPQKRKASELEDALGTQTKEKKRAKRGRPRKHESQEDRPIPFKAFSGSDPQVQEGAYRNTTTLMDGLNASYAVLPDTWGQIKQYTNVKRMIT